MSERRVIRQFRVLRPAEGYRHTEAQRASYPTVYVVVDVYEDLEVEVVARGNSMMDVRHPITQRIIPPVKVVPKPGDLVPAFYEDEKDAPWTIEGAARKAMGKAKPCGGCQKNEKAPARVPEYAYPTKWMGIRWIGKPWPLRWAWNPHTMRIEKAEHPGCGCMLKPKMLTNAIRKVFREWRRTVKELDGHQAQYG